MAGDWIKVEHATLTKPEILIAAELLGIGRREAIGLFLDYWAWLDSNMQESRNGFVTHVSRKSLEETMHCPGFAAVLERIKWAQFDDEHCTLCVLNWQRHNGKTAKSRALTRDRVKRSRNASSNASVTRAASPEKRREEVKPNGSKPASSMPNPSIEKANPQPEPWWKSSRGIETKAKEVGVEPRPGETHTALKRRVFDALAVIERGA